MIVVEISGERQRVRINSFVCEDAIDERTTCNFWVVNKDYDKGFQKGEPVTVYAPDLRVDSDWTSGKMEPVEIEETEEFFIQPEYVLDMEITKGEIVFSGVIERAEGAYYTKDGILFFEIECVDWHYAADKRLAAKSYSEQYAGDIIIDLWESYLKDEGIVAGKSQGCTFNHGTNTINATAHGLAVDDRLRFYTEDTLPAELSEGNWYYVESVPDADSFTISESEGGAVLAFTDDGTGDHSFGHDYFIDNGPVIKEAVFNYVPISQALDAISERTGMWWKIDEHRQIIYRERDKYTAPWTVTSSDILYGSLKIEHSAWKYRNRQVIRGPLDETAEQTDIQHGDGEKRAFLVRYRLARKPEIEIDTGGGFVVVDPGDIGILGLEENKKWYWNKHSEVISQDDAEVALSDTDKVKVTYRGLFPVVIITQDYESIIDRINIEQHGTGIVEDVKQETQQTTREAAFQFANNLIEKYRVIGNTVSFQTLRRGLRPGHIVNINLPQYGINNREMLVESVALAPQGNNLLISDVKGVEGPDIGSWTRLFTEIVRRGEMVIRENIGEGEVVIIPLQFNKTWEAGEAPNIFNEVYPDAVEPLYDATHGLSFAPEDRIKYVAWYDGATELGRKALTQQTGAEKGSTEIFTLLYLEGFEALGDISHIGWWGGIDVTEVIDSGIEIDKQAHPSGTTEKTLDQAWQIEKTDTKW